MDACNTLKVSIMGKHYLLSTDEDNEQIVHAAQLVDALMKSKAEKMPLNNNEKLAVIVALQLAAELAHKTEPLKDGEAERAHLIALVSELV
jgi:cell division protein ZapA (FtsZ GTPase activity inhibitor)